MSIIMPHAKAGCDSGSLARSMPVTRRAQGFVPNSRGNKAAANLRPRTSCRRSPIRSASAERVDSSSVLPMRAAAAAQTRCGISFKQEGYTTISKHWYLPGISLPYAKTRKLINGVQRLGCESRTVVVIKSAAKPAFRKLTVAFFKL